MIEILGENQSSEINFASLKMMLDEKFQMLTSQAGNAK